MTFSERLRAAQRATRSCLCVGLDPDPARLPAPLRDLPSAEAITAFCTAIVEATADVACAFKPNLAFFEALGAEGWRALEDVLDVVPEDRVVIADAKRGDIGNTAEMYAQAFFDRLGCHAVTVSPYMGRDALTPFLTRSGRCAFTLVLTSNPGAAELQELESGGHHLYEHVARMAVEAAREQEGEVGFVVGATRPGPLAALRRAYPDVPFLVPGVGTQGGDAAEILAAAGSGPLIVNVSRSILYASGGDDFAHAAARTAGDLAQILPA
jgi:orotidine-5'-phosphate decarboxylase